MYKMNVKHRGNVPIENASIGYARVSTEEQREKGMSLADQEEKLKAYAVAKGLTVSQIVTEDISGYKYLRERPGGQDILDAIQRQTVQHVICCKLDRMFRDAGDALVLSRKWQEKGITLHLIDIGVDTSSPHGRMFFTVMAGAAEMERNMIALRTRDALQYRKKHRLVYCRFAPYGWRKEGRKLVAIPEEQKIIAQIRAWRSEDKPVSFSRIAKRLNARKTPTKNGGKRWYMSTVKYILDRNLKD